MPKVDVTDEIIIDAPPMVVFRAILDEYSGITHFWMPHLEFKPRVAKLMDCEGGICDITARSHGLAANFSVKVIRIDPGKAINMELTGDLTGTENWIFEPLDGKTKVQLQWKGATNKLIFTLLSPIASAEKAHSESIQKGFKVLNAALTKK